MLGQLLEFSITASPVASALEFYRSLGFRELPVGDILSGPYAALWDGAITLGLQEREFDSPTPTFVRPDLKNYLRAFRHLGIELQFAELADDRFHEAGFLDPNGQLFMLVEARTFSPAGTWNRSDVSACGEFLELSLSTHSIDDSAAFWESVGLRPVAQGDEPHEWVRMQGHGLALGFHQTAPFRSGLTFRSDSLDARVQYLKAKGIELRRGAPVASDSDAVTLVTADGTAIYMLESPKQDRAVA